MKRFALLASALGLVLAFSACGPKQAEELKTTSTSAGTGWTRVANERAGISIKVPEGWTAIDMSSDRIGEVLDEIGKTNPNISKMAPQIKQLAASGLYKMFVIHTGASSETPDFADNINIVAQNVGAGADFDKMVDESMMGIASSTGAPTSTLKKDKVEAAGMDCRIVSAEFELRLPHGKIEVALRAYHFLKGSQFLAVTGSAKKDRMASLDKTYRDIVETLEVK